MKPIDEKTIAGGAAAAADELSAITEPFEKLIKALRRLGSTQIVGSDELIEDLNQTHAPQWYQIARDVKKDPRFRKLRSLAAECRPGLQRLAQVAALLEKTMRGE